MAFFRNETAKQPHFDKLAPTATLARRYVLRGRIVTMNGSHDVTDDGFLCIENDSIARLGGLEWRVAISFRLCSTDTNQWKHLPWPDRAPQSPSLQCRPHVVSWSAIRQPVHLASRVRSCSSSFSADVARAVTNVMLGGQTCR